MRSYERILSVLTHLGQFQNRGIIDHWSFSLGAVLVLVSNDRWSLLNHQPKYTINSVFKNDNVIDSQIDLLMLIQVFHKLII